MSDSDGFQAEVDEIDDEERRDDFRGPLPVVMAGFLPLHFIAELANAGTLAAFVAVGLFELMRALKVHPVQYFLVGAAIACFFLLLVSLLEQFSFSMAYAIAASACVALLTYYASHILQSWKRGMPFGAGIAVLYGLLFVLLRLEQKALIVGAVALFLVLALVMGLTRRVDWYARLQALGSSSVNAKSDAEMPR